MSAVCQIWLERLQPLFVVIALASLVYQFWLIRLRPPKRRKFAVQAVLAASVALNIVVIGGWIALLIRYR
jgi:predicted permease